MPFTVSHVAAVLPVVGRRHDGRIVPAAWVIGSMVPDVPWFFTGRRRDPSAAGWGTRSGGAH